MKKKIIAILLSIFLISIIPVTCIVSGLFLPAQYEKTYYAQLGKMFDKLYTTEGKKIVILGNSSVAFGVDSALMEEELNVNQIDYKVCNFGLYGALGTKMMLDLSLDAIQQDDIVVFMPEFIPQSMSLYFSAEQAWRALDQNKGMFMNLDRQNQSQLVGNFTNFVAEKYKYYRNGEAQGSGIYASNVFDENGDMKNYPRKENIMQNACDSENIFNFEKSILNNEFIDYVNEYFFRINEKGAKMFFFCGPINELSITKQGEENAETFFQSIREEFAFPLIGNPYNSIMRAEWFYDANVHLNEYGMTVYTAILTDALKTRLCDSSGTSIQIPSIPALPGDSEDIGEGDNTDAEYFLFEENEKGELTLTGLTEAGKKEKSLIIPWMINRKKVTTLSKEVFQGNDSIEEIIIQENIRRLQNESFDGCSSLKKIYLRHNKPSGLAISTDQLLKDTDNAAFYVYEDSVAAFVSDYSWSYYAKFIKGYR